ncbi:hypothetical protein SE_0204 [Staphylococcus epidermidis ATCC 12228]|uniref:Uncharacterized protein n=1 Tax=Staphylococcus epidermidis (strain ATCC 12228 / FDA PCI 1200) TaxID=176280 RepID=A0A0H2VG15_STAES|nr:hypothetical protein SE_0204 [Staphylococcus epidermidis ATCC 12228]
MARNDDDIKKIKGTLGQSPEVYGERKLPYT